MYISRARIETPTFLLSEKKNPVLGLGAPLSGRDLCGLLFVLDLDGLRFVLDLNGQRMDGDFIGCELSSHPDLISVHSCQPVEPITDVVCPIPR